MTSSSFTFPPICASRYEAVRPLDSGGFGDVYLAHQRSLDRPVVVKFLRGDDVAGDLERRFRDEAVITSRLHHPHIVRILDFESDDSPPWIAYEFLDGETLAGLATAGRIGFREAARMVLQISGALAHAHEQGVLHRDIKPDNILRAGSDFKLIDFGIGKWIGGEAVRTRAGVIFGTPLYMAPEQLTGGELSPRTDLYALGTVWYELLTGTLPFDGATTTDRMAARLREDPIPLRRRRPELPDWAERIVGQCLARKPERRFESAAHLREAVLERAGSDACDLIADLPPPGPTPGRRSPVGDDTVALHDAAPRPDLDESAPDRSTRRRGAPAARPSRARRRVRRWVPAVAGLILVLAMVSAGYIGRSGPESPRPAALRSDPGTGSQAPRGVPSPAPPPRLELARRAAALWVRALDLEARLVVEHDETPIFWTETRVSNRMALSPEVTRLSRDLGALYRDADRDLPGGPIWLELVYPTARILDLHDAVERRELGSRPADLGELRRSIASCLEPADPYRSMIVEFASSRLGTTDSELIGPDRVARDCERLLESLDSAGGPRSPGWPGLRLRLHLLCQAAENHLGAGKLIAHKLQVTSDFELARRHQLATVRLALASRTTFPSPPRLDVLDQAICWQTLVGIVQVLDTETVVSLSPGETAALTTLVPVIVRRLKGSEDRFPREYAAVHEKWTRAMELIRSYGLGDAIRALGSSAIVPSTVTTRDTREGRPAGRP